MLLTVAHDGEEVYNVPDYDLYDYKLCTNMLQIEKVLNMFDKALSKYPEGMFAQLEYTDEWVSSSKLHIYIVDEVIPTGADMISAAGFYTNIDGHTYIVLGIRKSYDLEKTYITKFTMRWRTMLLSEKVVLTMRRYRGLTSTPKGSTMTPIIFPTRQTMMKAILPIPKTAKHTL